jgi:pSer/pThr/pTyr-binding forkhead associated (FHA) protein
MNRKPLPFPLSISVFHKGESIFNETFTEYPITIGRSTKCDIPLSQFDFLSRQHCAINCVDDVLEITDLDSSNGMFFEGKKVKKAVFTDSSQIEVGEILIHFEMQKSPSEQATVVRLQDEEKEEVTAIKELKKVDPVIDIAKTRDIGSELGEKLSHQSKPIVEAVSKPASMPVSKPIAQKKARIPFDSALPNDTKPEVRKTIHPHPQSAQLRPQQRVLESYITWKDQIYDLHQFYAGDRVIVGSGEFATVELPILKKNIKMAAFDGMNTQVYIPQNLRFELENESNSYSFDEAAFSPSVSRKKNYYTLKLGPSELVSVELTSDVSIHLRYAPAPRQLSSKIRLIKDEEMKTPGMVIGVIEIMLFLMLALVKTKPPETAQKVMQERVARLIIEQKPPPPPPPEPKKEEKKIAKKQPTPKKKIVAKQPKPKKIVRLVKSKILKKINKYPVEVEKPLKVAERPVVKNIQAVGALAALGAVSSKVKSSDVPVAININKNAGGQTALNTGGVIGALKTKSGKLAAGGMASVKTKGFGYGTGTGYGVQGIKGTAGSRAVAGVVVGAPALVHLSKEDGLTRSQVMDVVKRYMSQIQQCYERSMIENPKLAGRVEYEWEITPRGSVKWAKVKKSDISGGDSLNKCVTRLFKQMSFPVAKNGQNTIPNIGFPFGRL